ncbi:MAG: HD domain-containing protein [Candidatus Omnitrophota bacterium]|nr:HD domain-containing protein [Candidatus Omnitrophota bacterium]
MNLQYFSKKIPYLFLISRIAKRRKIDIWLVGGLLRDIYLKIDKNFTDFDFCVAKDVLFVIREFAKKISSKFIVLDEKQGSYRVILKKRGDIYTYDFTLMRGDDFCQDLSLRDFSINTLAIRLNEKKPHLLDYFGARGDLSKKIIKVIKEEVLEQDPLRILRGFSFMVNYGLRIEKNTEKALARNKALLRNVSKERINEELFKIFSSPVSYNAIKRMDELRIIDEILPCICKLRAVSQGAYHHLDVWRHSLETLRSFEMFYRRVFSKDKEILDYLNEELAENRKRIQILKLSCILHDIGKPVAKRKKGKRTIFHTHEKIGRDMAELIAKDLRLSFREKEVLKKLIFWHLRPGYLADQTPPSQRAIYRFLRDTEGEGVGVILLSLSDWRATRGPLTDTKKRRRHEKIMLKLVKRYFEEKRKIPLPKLVDGYDIMRKFNLQPSPLVGKALKKIKEEQALGRVRTKSAAYSAVKALIHKNIKV